MKSRIMLALYSLLVFFALTGYVGAADQSIEDQFLGSPLLILVAVLTIDIVAFVYHKIRK